MNEIIKTIGEIGLKSIPITNWEIIKLQLKILITYSEAKSSYILNNEEKTFSAKLNTENGKSIYFEDFAWQLRETMYGLSPEKGAWYSMEMIIKKDGKFDLKFDYDHKPEFTIPIEDLDFIKDYQKFPRYREIMPNWLYEILTRNKIKLV